MEKAFDLLHPQTGDVLKTFHNRQARGAALKAAGNGTSDIILREHNTGTKDRASKLHRFTGSVQPDKWRLPLPDWKIASEAKRTGRTIPPQLNVRGGEDVLVKAGYELPARDKPLVKKVGVFNVPRVDGVDIDTAVREFLKTLPKAS